MKRKINKDPSFLLYPEKFIMGTMFMSNEEVGKYIKLLCVQHQCGGLIEKADFNDVVGNSEKLRRKFIETEDGFFNTKLMEVMEERNIKCNNLSDNAKIRWEKEKQKKCKCNANASSLDMLSLDIDKDINKDVVKDVKIKYAENVFLTEKEYNQILNKHFKGSKEWMDRAIEKLDAYKLSGDNTYKSDAGAIRSWVVKEMKKEALEENKNKPENKHAGIDEWLIKKTKEMEDA